MNRKLLCCLFASLCLYAGLLHAQTTPRATTPMMGWSSWNEFHVNISEQVIRGQADVMANSKLKAAGYHYVNTDDGFLAGRDAKGHLLTNTKRFPAGMKALATYIHSKGLKAGIYSDAGINLCAVYGDKDSIETGTGLYGHEQEDLTLMLQTWNYDFIKIDWCGGTRLGLDEQLRYTQLSQYIRAIKPAAFYNICRWQFPGKWAPLVADSWRISGDISNHFNSILHIIDLNADLWRYCTPGHFNDMDMLQVGRGMSLDEDRTHFTMWCIMNSPLLLGNDLRTISKETMDLVTNTEVIALNQDPLCYQARRLQKDGDQEVWAKPLGTTTSGQVGVALLNRANAPASITLNLDSIGIQPAAGYVLRDLWQHKDQARGTAATATFQVPAHGVVALKVTGTAEGFNIFQMEKMEH